MAACRVAQFDPHATDQRIDPADKMVCVVNLSSHPSHQDRRRQRRRFGVITHCPSSSHPSKLLPPETSNDTVSQRASNALRWVDHTSSQRSRLTFAGMTRFRSICPSSFFGRRLSVPRSRCRLALVSEWGDTQERAQLAHE